MFKLTDKYTFVEADAERHRHDQQLDYGGDGQDPITMMITVRTTMRPRCCTEWSAGPRWSTRMQALGLKTRAANVRRSGFRQSDRRRPPSSPIARARRRSFDAARWDAARDDGAARWSTSPRRISCCGSCAASCIARGFPLRNRTPSRTRPELPALRRRRCRRAQAPGKTIILTVFTGNHFGSGEALENAIGLVAKMSQLFRVSTINALMQVAPPADRPVRA